MNQANPLIRRSSSQQYDDNDQSDDIGQTHCFVPRIFSARLFNTYEKRTDFDAGRFNAE